MHSSLKWVGVEGGGGGGKGMGVRWGVFCAVLSCVRIVEFLPRLGKSSSKLEEERDPGLLAAELI